MHSTSKTNEGASILIGFSLLPLFFDLALFSDFSDFTRKSMTWPLVTSMPLSVAMVTVGFSSQSSEQSNTTVKRPFPLADGKVGQHVIGDVGGDLGHAARIA